MIFWLGKKKKNPCLLFSTLQLIHCCANEQIMNAEQTIQAYCVSILILYSAPRSALCATTFCIQYNLFPMFSAFINKPHLRLCIQSG